MTIRKPAGTHWESWIDRQIRDAEARGEFDDLPGSGRPLADLDKPHDENWWVKGKLRAEGLSYTPPSLALKKTAQDALAAAMAAASEVQARTIIDDINAKIRDANRNGLDGPSLMLVPYNIERVVQDWRAQHAR